ncbi:hypothetical protein [Endozoicomonas arenosclerae]|uniref:hypothetical protein n=1 Tax=Endozoicomonas arenosclerae TaxID=1633495 RepID=UPI000782D5CB|nr:hypothetical protein [Endozoicomonas arenosclerae]
MTSISQLNRTWHLIIRKGESANVNRNVYVLKQHYPLWVELKRTHTGNYYKTIIVRTAYQLCSMAGARNGESKSLDLEGGSLHYTIDSNGDVGIYLLEIDASIAPSGNQNAGVYRVDYDQKHEKWKTNNEFRQHLELDHTWNNNHYAAVGGQFETKEAAGRKLIEHIRNAYRLIERDINKHNNHYSLFWQKDQHSSDKHASIMLALLQQAMAKDARVNWLVHGEGAGTFVNAMKKLSANPQYQSMMAHEESQQYQNVYFSNPRGKGTRKEQLESLCKKVGFNLMGINHSPYDLKNPDNQRAALKEAGLIAAKGIVSGGFVAGLISQTSLEKSFHSVLGAGDPTTAVAFGAAGLVIANDVRSKLGGYGRNLWKGVGSTLGSGNQSWA